MTGSSDIRKGVGDTSGRLVGDALNARSTFGFPLAALLPLFSSKPPLIQSASSLISASGILFPVGGISGEPA